MSQLTLVTALSCSILACTTGCVGDGAADSPPEIRYGEDICAECGMIISDPRFASALVQDASDNEVEATAFDDIGDMLNYLDKHPGDNVIKLYVHDALTEEWLDATVAHYVSSDELETPMGHGLAAFAESVDADRMARELSGTVLDWDGLLAAHRAGTAGGAPVRVPGETRAAGQHRHGDMPEVILGETENDGTHLQLVSHEVPHPGRNTIMVHLTRADATPLEGARVTIEARLRDSQADGQPRGSLAKPLAEEEPGMYHGQLDFGAPGDGDPGPWTVIVIVGDPSTHESTRAVFGVDVASGAPARP